MLKSTRITVETDTLLIVRRAKAVLAWCPDCGGEVNVIGLTSESLADAASASQLQSWLDSGKLHLWQPAEGSVQICVPSLLQCLDRDEARALSSAVGAPLDQLRRRLKMKATRWMTNLFRFTCLVLMLGLSGSAWAQAAPPLPQYAVIDLGTLGGSFSIAYGLNNRGQIDGFSTTAGDTEVHGFVLNHGVITDLGTLGGPDSLAYQGPSESFQATGLAETAISDPNGEDFCGFGTNLICLAFSWQNGVMRPLSTLGGNNAQGGAINDRGQIAGYAENSTVDPNCPAPQVLEFKAAVWTGTQIQALPDYAGDPEGAAFWINDRGDVVGASGSCAPFDPRYGVGFAPQHAMLWRKASAPTYLGTLGGSFNNSGFAINNLGQIVGASDLAGDQYQHAFFWQNGVMTDMGTLSGDVVSAALGINNRGQAVGLSQDAGGNIRAFLWQNGTMTDLNTLISPDSPLYLLHGYGINDSGEIVGFAYVFSSGEIHGFLAIPMNGAGAAPASAMPARPSLPENVRRQLQQYVHSRLFAARAGK